MRNLLFGCLLLSAIPVAGAKEYAVVSPDGRLKADINVGKELTYSVSLDGKELISPSPLSMTLANGTVWGAVKGRENKHKHLGAHTYT